MRANFQRILCFAIAAALTHSSSFINHASMVSAEIPEFYQLPYNLTLDLIDRNNRTLDEIARIQKTDDYSVGVSMLSKVIDEQLELMMLKLKKVIDDNAALRENVSSKAEKLPIDLRDCESIRHEGSMVFVAMLGSLRLAADCLKIHSREPLLTDLTKDDKIPELREKLGKARVRLDACFDNNDKKTTTGEEPGLVEETKIFVCFTEQHDYIQENYATVLLPMQRQVSKAKTIVEDLKPEIVVKCTQGSPLFSDLLKQIDRVGVRYRECIAKKLPNES